MFHEMLEHSGGGIGLESPELLTPGSDKMTVEGDVRSSRSFELLPLEPGSIAVHQGIHSDRMVIKHVVGRSLAVTLGPWSMEGPLLLLA